METNSLYSKIYNIGNLILAWRRARKGKTRKPYVKEFEKDTLGNLLKLQEELKTQSYFPKPLETFILRDPKTRKISKADFRDRIVHHALHRVIEPILDKSFIYDSCANRVGKGNLFALRRLELFWRKVTNNLQTEAFCLKADIKHYFQEVNHKILFEIIKRKINDEKVILLIKRILDNGRVREGVGMPLGNLTSQFFANVYLHELDFFIKHKLRAKYYIRYVDDFVILHESCEQLELWKREIEIFLREKLKLELHPEKSRVLSLSNGVDFVGFRCFWNFRIVRKRNIRKIAIKIKAYQEGLISFKKILESFRGWNAYSMWADSFKLRNELAKNIFA